MKTLARLVCTSALVLAPVARIDAGEPRDSGDIQIPRIYDLEKMTEHEALQLDGKQIVVRARLKERSYHQAEVLWTCEGDGARWLTFRNKNDAPKLGTPKE